MTDSKKRVLVAGLLALCVAKLVWPHRTVIGWYWFEGFSLSTLAALCGAWACCVYLMPNEWKIGNVKAAGKNAYMFLISSLLILSAVGTVGFFLFAIIKAIMEST